MRAFVTVHQRRKKMSKALDIFVGAIIVVVCLFCGVTLIQLFIMGLRVWFGFLGID
jgi:hypothetical protein